MAGMREPYAHIRAEVTDYESRAIHARQEILRLEGIAEAYERMVVSLSNAIDTQIEADELMELSNKSKP